MTSKGGATCARLHRGRRQRRRAILRFSIVRLLIDPSDDAVDRPPTALLGLAEHTNQVGRLVVVAHGRRPLQVWERLLVDGPDRAEPRFREIDVVRAASAIHTPAHRQGFRAPAREVGFDVLGRELDEQPPPDERTVASRQSSRLMSDGTLLGKLSATPAESTSRGRTTVSRTCHSTAYSAGEIPALWRIVSITGRRRRRSCRTAARRRARTGRSRRRPCRPGRSAR